MQILIPVFIILSCVYLSEAATSKLVKRQQNPDFFFPDDDNNNINVPGPVDPSPVNPGPVNPPVPTQSPPTTTTIPPETSTSFPGLSETTTPPPPGYFTCLQNCPTTNEYNPICGSNRVQYFNEQKFNCARLCGAQVSIVRRGSCTGLVKLTIG